LSQKLISYVVTSHISAAQRGYRLAPFQKRKLYCRLRKEDMDLPIFDFSVLVKVTNNFSSVNKIGEGGFGPVYKVIQTHSMKIVTFPKKINYLKLCIQGTLVEGKEVAIKRHSKVSDQGLEEFKNEIVLIAKLQHRNLVKLLGCCSHKDEMLLMYEYMPNKSLDYFIFG
jgi:serine/threonine protein kinase